MYESKLCSFSMDDHWKTSGNVTTVRIRSLMEAIPQNRFNILSFPVKK